MHFMLETIIAAHLLGVDAFDQPAVEEGKVLAKKYLMRAPPRPRESVAQCKPADLNMARFRFAGTIERRTMHRVTDTISIDDSELSESFVRASGPGGQNVNKVSSAVQLRFDVRRSPSLPNDVAVRLMRLAGKRLTKEGVIVIVAQAHRDQDAQPRRRARAAVRPDPPGGG